MADLCKKSKGDLVFRKLCRKSAETGRPGFEGNDPFGADMGPDRGTVIRQPIPSDQQAVKGQPPTFA